MLFEKARHPDQSLYIHPGSLGVDNPTMLVPAFIERRYDEMVDERSRDGNSNSLTTKMSSLDIKNNRIDMKPPTNNHCLPPIQESDNVIRSEVNGSSLSDTENNNNIENTDSISKEDLATSCIQNINLAEGSTLRHPLKHSWTFWYFDMNGGAANWDENLKKIVAVSTVEDFWAVYHHMKEVSQLDSGCDYALFKTGIRPMWEDTANKEGGRWLLQLDRFQRTQWLDQIWLEIMLFLIGGDHTESGTEESVNGAVVNIRNKADKVALWLPIADKSKGHGPKILEVGQELKSRMGIPKHFPINFETHTNVSSRRGSTAKSEFTL